MRTDIPAHYNNCDVTSYEAISQDRGILVRSGKPHTYFYLNNPLTLEEITQCPVTGSEDMEYVLLSQLSPLVLAQLQSFQSDGTCSLRENDDINTDSDLIAHLNQLSWIRKPMMDTSIIHFSRRTVNYTGVRNTLFSLSPVTHLVAFCKFLLLSVVAAIIYPFILVYFIPSLIKHALSLIKNVAILAFKFMTFQPSPMLLLDFGRCAQSVLQVLKDVAFLLTPVLIFATTAVHAALFGISLVIKIAEKMGSLIQSMLRYHHFQQVKAYIPMAEVKLQGTKNKITENQIDGIVKHYKQHNHFFTQSVSSKRLVKKLTDTSLPTAKKVQALRSFFFTTPKNQGRTLFCSIATELGAPRQVHAL